MKEIYLDNSATTAVLPEIAELMTKIYTQDYGNPSSLHNKGVEAEKYIKEAKAQIAKVMKIRMLRYFSHPAVQNPITWQYSVRLMLLSEKAII